MKANSNYSRSARGLILMRLQEVSADRREATPTRRRRAPPNVERRSEAGERDRRIRKSPSSERRRQLANTYCKASTPRPSSVKGAIRLHERHRPPRFRDGQCTAPNRRSRGAAAQGGPPKINPSSRAHWRWATLPQTEQGTSRRPNTSRPPREPRRTGRARPNRRIYRSLNRRPTDQGSQRVDPPAPGLRQANTISASSRSGGQEEEAAAESKRRRINLRTATRSTSGTNIKGTSTTTRW